MAAAQLMQCMEVWGGNALVDSAVTVAGLDAWVYSKPHGQADGGGDVYYVSSCATGRIARLLVADVTGHGAAVCDAAGQLRGLMRRYVNYLDQSKFVTSMNHQFVACSAAGCFATAVVSTFFASTRTLSVCNAGHPPPLLWRAKARAWSLLDRGAAPGAPACGNIPLGIDDYDDCSQFDVNLDVGDLVLVYTDSLIEARDPAGGAMLGPAGLLGMVGQLLPDPDPSTLITTLLAAIDGRTDRGLDADDVTLLLLRANGTGGGIALHRSFLAPFRVLASVARALAGRGPMSLPDWNLANLGGAAIPALSRRWRRT